MTVNANVRCIEWFDANIITPSNPAGRFVLGWYEDGHIRRVRILNGEWTLANYGPGELRHEYAKPTHWCDFPDGPGEDAASRKSEPEYQAQLKWARDVVSNVVIPPASDGEVKP